jgi:hypothetical protein
MPGEKVAAAGGFQLQNVTQFSLLQSEYMTLSALTVPHYREVFFFFLYFTEAYVIQF